MACNKTFTYIYAHENYLAFKKHVANITKSPGCADLEEAKVVSLEVGAAQDAAAEPMQMMELEMTKEIDEYKKPVPGEGGLHYLHTSRG